MPKNLSELKRAVGYCRTSGESQRDNTSIPTQKEDIKAFCKREGLSLQRCYVDEAKSGAKIAGRDDFQRLMRDAAAGLFDVAVVYRVSRWGRDGADIIESSKALRRDFGVDVVDTAGAFDTRKRANTLMNFVHAGVAEHERLVILERTMGGRIARARAGEPWCGAPPAGRAWDRDRKRWYITDQGREIARMLERYARGESVSSLGREYEQNHAREFKKHYFKTWFSKWVHESQLAGPYTVHFKSPDIDLDEKVVVPGIPPVVSEALLKRVKARLAHNTRFTRTDAAKRYPLSGFIYCAECKRALSGQTTTPAMGGLQYYRHDRSECPAPWMSVRGEKLTEAVLDYLYTFFLDEPAFNRAVEDALPSAEHRDELERDRDAAMQRLGKVERAIARLVDAVAAGADVSILVDRQESLKLERQLAQQRLGELEAELAALPCVKDIQLAAELARIDLQQKYSGRDWRKLSHEDIKRFLHHLFGPNPRETGTGIFVNKNDRGLSVTFRGAVAFDRPVKAGKPHPLEVLESPEMEKVRAAYREKQSAGARRDKLAARIRAVESAQEQVLKAKSWGRERGLSRVEANFRFSTE